MKIQAERYAGQDTLTFCIAGVIFGLLILLMGMSAAPAQESVVIVEENITVTPTIIIPTIEPEPTLSMEQIMEQTGGLHNGTWLNIKRDNVSMLKDMSLHARVWGYREFSIINWWSVSWGRSFPMGAGEGKKFLFVFVQSYSDDHMSTMWGLQPHQWVISSNGHLYNMTDELLPEIRIQEFDEIYDARHVETIKPYGYIRTHKSAVSGKEIAEPIEFLKAGESNGWDGYVPFIVPADLDIKDVQVHLITADLAEPHWWTLV